MPNESWSFCQDRSASFETTKFVASTANAVVCCRCCCPTAPGCRHTAAWVKYNEQNLFQKVSSICFTNTFLYQINTNNWYSFWYVPISDFLRQMEKRKPTCLKAALLTAITIVHLNKVSNKSGKFQFLMFPSDCSLKVDQWLGNIWFWNLPLMSLNLLTMHCGYCC